jgi:putative ABC transport system permease protein
MFDQEDAIKKWRKRMEADPSLEPGQIAEVESHLRDKVDDLVARGRTPEQAFDEAVRALGEAGLIGSQFFKVYTPKRSGRPSWQPPRFVPGLVWNYMRVAMRHIGRQRAYAFINIGGLALGVAAGLIVMVFVRDELGYDRFHAKADRIYRLAYNIHIENRVDSALLTPPILVAALAEEFPEIEATARVAQENGIVKIGDQRFFSNGVYAADPGFFEVFSFPLASGDPKTALAEPNRVILTRSAVRKCFGGADPTGRVLSIGGTDFTVTGVAEDCPRNSHFHFEFLTSITTYPESKSTGWFEGFCATYVVLRPGASPHALGAKLPDFVLRHHFGGNKGKGPFKDWVYFLQPLTSIHLRSHLLFGEFEVNGSPAYVYIFLFIAGFVLVIACVNYVNLATARSVLRGREVGVRKVLGSKRAQLVRQFLAESVLTTFAAFVIAGAIVLALLPAFHGLTGKDIGAGDLAEPQALLFIILLAVIVGAGSGIYPALVLSSFRPAAVLGGARSAGPCVGAAALRKGLIVLQFAISTFLLISTAVVYEQTDYFQSKRLGFDREHVLVVRDAQLLGKEVRAFKDRLLRVPSVERAALASALPGSNLDDLALRAVLPEGSRDDLVVEMVTCDEDFPAALGLDMAAGRFFSPDRPADERALVINETAARDLGWPQPIGKTIKIRNKDLVVIGVVKDFHVHSLHAKIPRTVFEFTGDSRVQNGSYLALRVRPGDLREVVAQVREAWDSFSPPLPLTYSFLDEDYAALYAAETRAMKVLGVFSGLAVAVSCLGLFGLASFMTERRRREIGIRKVLGARADEIVALLGKEFLRWVLLANLVGWPAAFFVTRRWLDRFAYRVDIGVWPFLLSGAVALVVAAVTLAYRTLRAARANPADSLRYE